MGVAAVVVARRVVRRVRLCRGVARLVLVERECPRMTQDVVGFAAVGVAGGAAAGAAAATAGTPDASQMVYTGYVSTRTVIVLTDSTMAVIFSEAMVGYLH